MHLVPRESYCLRWTTNCPFLRKNLDLSIKSTHYLVFYLYSMLYGDNSPSKASALAASAGIAATGVSWKAEYAKLAQEIQVTPLFPEGLKTYTQWVRDYQTFTRSNRNSCVG
jgi:hypothetical protein